MSIGRSRPGGLPINLNTNWVRKGMDGRAESLDKEVELAIKSKYFVKLTQILKNTSHDDTIIAAHKAITCGRIDVPEVLDAMQKNRRYEEILEEMLPPKKKRRSK